MTTNNDNTTALTTYNEEYLKRFQIDPAENDEAQDLASAVNPLDLLGRLKLGMTMTVVRGRDETQEILLTERAIFAIPVWVGARRALWPTDDYDARVKSGDILPDDAGSGSICQTGTVRLRTFDRRDDIGIGWWNDSYQLEDLPHTEIPEVFNDNSVDCQHCPLNQFGSAGTWQGGGGKACGERRVLALRIVRQVTQIGKILIFEPHPDVIDLVIADLSASSIRTVSAMATLAMARRLKMSNMVFELSAEEKGSGKFKYFVMNQEFVGFPSHDLADNLERQRNMAQEFLLTQRKRKEEVEEVEASQENGTVEDEQPEHNSNNDVDPVAGPDSSDSPLVDLESAMADGALIGGASDGPDVDF